MRVFCEKSRVGSGWYRSAVLCWEGLKKSVLKREREEVFRRGGKKYFGYIAFDIGDNCVMIFLG